MANFNIKIDVYGQFDKGSGHQFTYPEQFSAMGGNNQWLNTVTDPRADLINFAKLDKCYAFWCAPEGWFVSIIRKNPHDSRGGYGMVSMLLGRFTPDSNSNVAMLLDKLSEKLIIEKSWSNATVEACLQQCPLRLIPSGLMQFSPTGSCYRTYATNADLDNQLSSPAQTGYARHSRVFLIPEAASAYSGNGKPVENVSSSILVKKTYHVSVQEPTSTRVNVVNVHEGEKITITYSKPGFSDMQSTVLVNGVPNAGVVYNNREITIKSPKEAGVIFKKKLKIMAVNAKNKGAVSGCRFNVAMGSTVETGVVEFLCPENIKEVQITCKANGFEDMKQMVNVANLRNGEIITVPCTPMESNISLFTKINGVRFNAAKTFDQSSMEYRQLMNGKFGAHSVMKSGNGFEVVLSSPGRVVDHYEDEEEEGFNWKKITIAVLGALIMLGAGVGIGYWLRNSLSNEDKKTTGDGNGEVEAVEDVIDSTQIKKDSIRQVDLAYLKKNDVWNIDSIQTEELQNLVSNVSHGILDNIHMLDSLPDSQINGYWKSFVIGCDSIKNESALIATLTSELSTKTKDTAFDLKFANTSVVVLVDKMNAAKGLVKDVANQNVQQKQQGQQKQNVQNNQQGQQKQDVQNNQQGQQKQVETIKKTVKTETTGRSKTDD